MDEGMTEKIEGLNKYLIARNFIAESNKIEGIDRQPTEAEIAEYERFMGLSSIDITDCDIFVCVYQPNARLRSKVGMNVRVGNHRPPKGCPEMKEWLSSRLRHLKIMTPYFNHQEFEDLHPYTDCNGRLGRMIWMWQMREAPLGFLHTFYYQSLNGGR